MPIRASCSSQSIENAVASISGVGWPWNVSVPHGCVSSDMPTTRSQPPHSSTASSSSERAIRGASQLVRTDDGNDRARLLDLLLARCAREQIHGAGDRDDARDEQRRAAVARDVLPLVLLIGMLGRIEVVLRDGDDAGLERPA